MGDSTMTLFVNERGDYLEKNPIMMGNDFVYEPVIVVRKHSSLSKVTVLGKIGG